MSSERPLILITGGSGLIGSRIAAAMAGGYELVLLDVKPPENELPGGEFIECDLTDDQSVERALWHVAKQRGNKLTSVIHLAAYYDFSGEPSPLYDELTVEGTRRLLHGLQKFEVEQFVFSSSLLVMRPAEVGDQITEASSVEAAWDYPESKLEAEELIRAVRGDIPAAILRIAGVYDEDCHSVPIGQQIARIYEKQLESYFFPGDAGHGQAFVHLEDLVDAVVKTVVRRGALSDFEVLLIAEPDVVSYAELQDRIGELLHGDEWPTIRIPKLAAKVGAWVQDKLAGENEPTFIKPWMVDLADQHYPVAIERARKKLGWQPKHRLRTTIDEMIRRLKRDPVSWYETNGLPLPVEFRRAK